MVIPSPGPHGRCCIIGPEQCPRLLELDIRVNHSLIETRGILLEIETEHQRGH
jgi:hypothetical protein